MCISAVQHDALASYEFTERELARYKRDGFEIVVRAEPEMINPLEYFGVADRRKARRFDRAQRDRFLFEAGVGAAA